MRRVRLQIGSLVIRHPALTPADASFFGRNLERRLAELIRQKGIPPQLESGGIIHVQPPHLSAGTSREGTAHAVAQTLYRGLSKLH